jgi:YNFM family putative membrane transporter
VIKNYAPSDKRYPWMTAILFWCGLAVVSSVYITIPLAPVFASDFNLSLSQAAWSSSVFSFCYAVGFLFFGPLSDRFGRKPIILFGLVSLTIISPIIGWINHFLWLLILRGIQGIAASTFGPSALAYVVEMFPKEKQVTTIGFVSTGFLMSGIVGQVVSSLVNQHLGWNEVFFLFGLVYLVTTLIAMFFLPSGTKQQTTGSILASFQQMKRLLTKKYLLFCYLITITLLLAFVGMYTALGSYLTDPTFRLDHQSILYVRAVGMIGMFISPFAGRLVAKFGIHTVLRSGLSLAVIGLTALGVGSNLPFLVITSIVFVSGISLTIPTLISLVGQLGGKARGAAVALYTFVLFLGATLGPMVAIGLLKTGSYLVTFEMLALLLGIGLISSFMVKS